MLIVWEVDGWKVGYTHEFKQLLEIFKELIQKEF